MSGILFQAFCGHQQRAGPKYRHVVSVLYWVSCIL